MDRTDGQFIVNSGGSVAQTKRGHTPKMSLEEIKIDSENFREENSE